MGEAGNAALVGHRDGFFRGLKDTSIGDELILETEYQKERYKVTEVFLVAPEDVYDLEHDGEAMITPLTIYPFCILGHAPERFIARARPREEAVEW